MSSKSSPTSVAGAVAGVVRTDGAVQVQVVGAGALNQAIKAIAVARSFLVDEGADRWRTPTCAEVDIDGEQRTAIRLLVERREAAEPLAAAGS